MVNITNNQGNENQTIVRCHFIPTRMAKKQTKPSEISVAVRMWRKWSSVDTNVKWRRCYGKQYRSSLKN